MNKRLSQTGSAHASIAIVIIIVLAGVIGWVFWTKFQQNQVEDSENKNAASKSTDEQPQYKDWKRYDYNEAGISFQYPSSWVVSSFPINHDEGRFDPSVQLSFDDNADEVGMWPSIRLFDNTLSRNAEPAPTMPESKVVYTETLANSKKLVCLYYDRVELPGQAPTQRLLFNLYDQDFDENDGTNASALIQTKAAKFTVDGGDIFFRDGSLPEDKAKQMCSSPTPDSHVDNVLQWMRHIKFTN